MATEKKIRNSQQRDLVYNIVMESRDHPTAETVYMRARKCDDRISAGTVYRNLNMLSDMGLIRRLPMIEGPDHYDYNLSNHYHFLCKCCHRVEDIAMEYVDFKITNKMLNNCDVEGYNLVFYGICSNCKINESEEK